MLVWDAPGHAASWPFDFSFDLADKARWLDGILRAEGIESPVVVGQSMGGYVGQMYAQLFPGKLRGFVAIDSAPLQRRYVTAAEIWLLKRMEPTEFGDVVAANALYRPGPMEVNAHLDYADRKNGKTCKCKPPVKDKKINDKCNRKKNVRRVFGNNVRERRFHAVDPLNYNAFEGTGRHIQNSAKRNACEFVAHFFSDVAEQIESRNVAHARGDCVEQNVSKPEKCRDSALNQKQFPVAHTVHKLPDNLRNHKIRCNAARYAEKGKKHAYDVLSFFFPGEIENPPKESPFRFFYIFI